MALAWQPGAQLEARAPKKDRMDVGVNWWSLPQESPARGW